MTTMNRWIELGCGEHPSDFCQVHVDARPIPGVTDFVQDLTDLPWRIADADFDGVLLRYVLEHVSYRLVPAVLAECRRILKPGGEIRLTVPNTAAQMDWIQDHPNGWDGKPRFEAASELLFGSQDYKENAHACYLDIYVVKVLLEEAGFGNVQTSPAGERGTDLDARAFVPKADMSWLNTFGNPGFDEGLRAAEELARLRAQPAGRYASEAEARGAWAEGQTLPHEHVAKVIAAGTLLPLPRGPAEPPAHAAIREEMQAAVAARKPFALEGEKEVTVTGTAVLPGPSPLLKALPAFVAAEAMEAAQQRNREHQAEPLGGYRPLLPLSHADENRTSETPREGEAASPVKPTDYLERMPPKPEERPDPAALFDHAYFNGGGKVGGYAREGYRDFPCHAVTAAKVLERKPESVLELGCARGYVLKRIQDAGIPAQGFEVSRHCVLTRVCEQIIRQDLCVTPWAVTYGNAPESPKLDLCYSVATLEHVPEAALPAVIAEMARVSKRGLHGVDFGAKDDGFDKTHCTLKPKQWWQDLFAQHAPGYPVEVVDKESLEAGPLPPEVTANNGKLKLNLGCGQAMFHRGWVNVDVDDLTGFSAPQGYAFVRLDLRTGLPWGTGAADLIFLGHVLDRLSYADGLRLLRECRRVLKPATGALRVVVPDADYLMRCYYGGGPEIGEGLYPAKGPQRDEYWGDLWIYDEADAACAAAPTAAAKLHALLYEGRAAAYDAATLEHALKEAGFHSRTASLHASQTCDSAVGEHAGLKRLKQILRETTEYGPAALFVEAVCST